MLEYVTNLMSHEADEFDYESLPSSSVGTHMSAGAMAGMMEHVIMYPLDSVKVSVLLTVLSLLFAHLSCFVYLFFSCLLISSLFTFSNMITDSNANITSQSQCIISISVRGPLQNGPL